MTDSVFQGRSLLSTRDYTKDELMWLIGFAEHLKDLKRQNIAHHYLEGKNIALLFEKTSTRTRAAFTTACIDLGAHPEYLGKGDIQLGKKETVRDTALVLGSMFDGIEFRGFKQSNVEELAEYSGVPVWNGLTDKEHPTQMLADFMTIKENLGTLEDVTLAYIGQGRNNVQNSLMITSAILGVNYVNATPAELEPDPEILAVAKALAEQSGATITVTNDPVEAVADADVVYTNVWAAMGEEGQFAERVRLMSPYQVNAELVSHIKNPDWIFLHCLPAFHNAETDYAADIEAKHGISAMEVTDDVFYSDHGRQFQQAENRMHTIKAIMAATLGNLYVPSV
ncbi:ornithine carbamoyltransferase [Adlercreutzia muris]|jgi:ornithine carbamoyltransferase|uniref:ornithine carbamoyltransferase n=1 Tax=Adlercreutzia muris TaxID=1796610 RepID=UPI0010943433|nr:ornithine carbamoyltransferase [Adlercreutzia muris]MCI8305610.1 ornithine carbamoyltransferase [Enterorhabdus sp.]MCI9673672.1 ornithine carbamoyltransferase [Enterorhabdus sp.]NCA31326.1 ornithine carbamoyltransferase [Adlercreutzia muris]TGY75421.1 ornithine carbamoyltransferase [Enterorhabdus sp. NM05_H27]